MRSWLVWAAALSVWLTACGPIEIGFVITPTPSVTALVEPVIRIVTTRTSTTTVTASTPPTETPPPSETPVPPTSTRRPVIRTATATITPSETPSPSPSPTVTITPTPCAHTWFFSALVPARCPESAAQSSNAAAQRFERGRMIWFQIADRYFIFTGITSGSLLTVNGPLSGDPTPVGTPPPVGGFGILWRIGAPGVPAQRDVLGWAVELEFNYAAVLQCEVKDGNGQHCYLRLPEGPVVEYFKANWRQW
ncbi:MAG: hypothetical protein ACT4QE_01885 [Anaerolineales bacterium]